VTLATLLWIVVVILVIAGIFAIIRKQVIWGVVLIVVGLLVGPVGGASSPDAVYLSGAPRRHWVLACRSRWQEQVRDSGNPIGRTHPMAAVAVTIAPDGRLTEVDLGDPDLRSVQLRSLIGCAAVRPIWLAADLLMWAVDPADGLLNVSATDIVMTTADIANQTISGTVVCTGPAADGVDIAAIPARWARYLTNHRAVQPVGAVAQPVPLLGQLGGADGLARPVGSTEPQSGFERAAGH
jgi:hypothetical protein